MAIRIRANGAAPPPAAATSSFMQRMGGLRGLLGTGARIGSGILATEGGPLGAGIAGGGEALAELIEGSGLNPARIAVEGGVGAVPLSSVFKLGRAGTSALRSGALSAAGTAGRELSMGENLDPRAIAESGGLGALLGGVIGHMSSPPAAKPAGRMLETEPTAQPGGQVLSSKGHGLVETKGGRMRTFVPDTVRVEPELPWGAHSPVDFRRPEVPPAWAPSREVLQQELDDIARLNGEVPEIGPGPSKLDTQLNSWAATDELNAEENARRLAAVERARTAAGLEPTSASGSSSISGKTALGSESFRQGFGKPREADLSGADNLVNDTPELAAAEGPTLIELLHKLASGEMDELPGVAGKPRVRANTDGSFTQGNLTKGGRETDHLGGVSMEEPQTLEGFGPSGVNPPGVLSRFFGVQQPSEMPRAPRALNPKQQAAAESERLLKAKMAEEAQPRPTEWDQYPPEVAQELDRLGLQYRSAPEGLEKRGLGAQLQELRMFMSGKNAKGQPYMREGWKGAPTEPPTTNVPASPKPKMRANLDGTFTPVAPDWVQKETAVADDIGRQLEQQAGGPPPDASAPDWVREQSGLVDKLKALLMNQSGGGGERGEISPELLQLLGGAGGGALLGSVVNPTGDPLEGAMYGGAAGATAVGFGPKIINGMKNLGAAPEAIQEAGQQLAAEGPKKTAQRIFETWPQFQRFNMLLNEGLPANAAVGPWGSAMTGAIEAGLSGDERGWRLAKALMTPEFAQQLPKHYNDAVELIRNGDLGRAETIFGDSPVGKAMTFPGTLMTTGDVTGREMGKARGFTEQEMRDMTMTNEPEFEGFRKLSNLTKNTPMLQTLMPFTKTLANMGEQGAMRAPVLGLFVQAMRETPAPMRTQLVQQAMSVGIGGANYFLGQQLSPEEAKIVRRYATNIAGRYGIIAGAGFAAGQASAQGRDPLSAGLLRGTQEALPLPTTEIPESWINFIFGGESAPIPRGLMPTPLSDELFPQAKPAPRLPSIRIRRPQ